MPTGIRACSLAVRRCRAVSQGASRVERGRTMDGNRFDDLVRDLTGKRLSRLDAVRSLAATAAAAVAGVSLFAQDSEAVNNGKGPKSNPKRKKKTICHCATFDPAS